MVVAETEKIIQVRQKNEITIPQKIRDLLDIHSGDWVGFKKDGQGGICIYKVIPQEVNIT